MPHDGASRVPGRFQKRRGITSSSSRQLACRRRTTISQRQWLAGSGDLAVDGAAGQGADAGGPRGRRGKNAPPAADPRPTFIFRVRRNAVARWSACGGIFTRGDDRAASRAPPSSPPLSGAHARRLADNRATDVLPGRRRLRQRHTRAEGEHGAAGNRVERFLAASSVRAFWWRRGRSSTLRPYVGT